MDGLQKFNSTSLLEKENFYIHLNMEHITDADCMHGKRVHKDFDIKNLGEYHDLYLQSNTLLLSAEVFEEFWNMGLQIYELYSSISYCTRINMASPPPHKNKAT